MNLNYVGSLAERFMKFRATLASTVGVAENLFNAISIYVPKSLAEDNLSEDAYDPDVVTATSYAVIPVTVDNYKEVMADGSVLLSQWLPVFNDGTNSAVTLYLIVFDDTSFNPTVTATAITWAPLTKAFNELYFISFFKVMFSEHYNGEVVESTPEAETDYDDSNYFDMCLCLAYQCSLESELSFFLCEAHLTIPETASTADSNACKVLSQTRGTETTHCTTLLATTKADRAQYFWGYVHYIGGEHTYFMIHNGAIMLPIVLGRWFEAKNDSGEFVGNKFCKIRLNNAKVKPTGLPSPLNTDVNLNLISAWYNNLDEKNVGYFISISGSSQNDAQLISDRSVSNYPLTAYMMKCWICYNASQSMADYSADVSTLTDPVLMNETTYSYIQSLLISTINKMAGSKRLEGATFKFPPFAEAKQGNKFVGTAVWSAGYVDDFGAVDVSGSISF